MKWIRTKTWKSTDTCHDSFISSLRNLRTSIELAHIDTINVKNTLSILEENDLILDVRLIDKNYHFILPPYQYEGIIRLIIYSLRQHYITNIGTKCPIKNVIDRHGCLAIVSIPIIIEYYKKSDGKYISSIFESSSRLSKKKSLKWGTKPTKALRDINNEILSRKE